MTDPAAPPPHWTAPWTGPGPSAPTGVAEPSAAPRPAPEPVAAERRAQLRAAAVLVWVLAAVGAVLGVVWQAWSPPGPAGIELPGGVQADETEAFVAGDGRFVLIAAIVGLLAGLAAWYVPRLRAARGPYVALGLAVGGIAGSALMELVGWLIRGDGSTYRCGDGSLTCNSHLPLTVHMHALLLIEAVVALLVYILFVAFAVADDLGRPDPTLRQDPRTRPGPPGPPMPSGPPMLPGQSVGPQGDLQHPWPHGDGARPPQ